MTDNRYYVLLRTVLLFSDPWQAKEFTNKISDLSKKRKLTEKSKASELLDRVHFVQCVNN